MTIDSVSNMLTSIRNAQKIGKSDVEVPISKFRQAILAVIKKNNYISDYKIKNNHISIKLNYPYKQASISKIKRISKPGLRIYKTSHKIPRVMQGYGMVIISTSQGVMTGEEARKKNLGGEIICEIY